MAFEKMDQMSNKASCERSCMMMYGFTAKEMQMIQTVGKMTGIKDFIVLKPCHGNNTLLHILEGNPLMEEGEGTKEKALVLNHIASTRMNAFIEGLKKYRMQRPLIAVVTETSIKWELEELLQHLKAERAAVNRGDFTGK